MEEVVSTGGDSSSKNTFTISPSISSSSVVSKPKPNVFFNAKSDYSISVDNSIDLSNSFNGRKNIKLQNKQSLSYDVEFYHNFDLQDLDLSNVKVVKENTQENNYILIKNLKLQEGETKKVKLPKMKNTNLICIKDLSLNSIDELSDNCDNENEFVIECNNKKVEGGYKCSIENNHYVIHNLKHSAIKEIEKTENIPPPLVPLTAKNAFIKFTKDVFNHGRDLFFKYFPNGFSSKEVSIFGGVFGAITILIVSILIHNKKHTFVKNEVHSHLKTIKKSHRKIGKTSQAHNINETLNFSKHTHIEKERKKHFHILSEIEKIKEYVKKHRNHFTKSEMKKELIKSDKFKIDTLTNAFNEKFFNEENFKKEEIKNEPIEKKKIVTPHIKKIKKNVDSMKEIKGYIEKYRHKYTQRQIVRALFELNKFKIEDLEKAFREDFFSKGIEEDYKRVLEDFNLENKIVFNYLHKKKQVPFIIEEEKKITKLNELERIEFMR